MAQIKNEQQYKATCDRINELLKIVGNDTPADDKNMLELDLISDLVADYEEEHYPRVTSEDEMRDIRRMLGQHFAKQAEHMRTPYKQ